MVGDLSTWYLGEEAISAAANAAAVDTGEGGSAPGTMAAASTQRGLFFGVAIGEDACLRDEKISL